MDVSRNSRERVVRGYLSDAQVAEPRTTIMTHVSLVLPLHCASRRTGGVSDDELIHHGFFLAFSFPRRMAWI